MFESRLKEFLLHESDLGVALHAGKDLLPLVGEVCIPDAARRLHAHLGGCDRHNVSKTFGL